VCTPPNTYFLGPSRVQNANGISISSADFVQLTAEIYYTLQCTSLYNYTFPCEIAPSIWGSGPHLIHGSLGPPKYQPKWQPFLRSSRQNIPMPYNEPTFLPPLKIVPYGGSGAPSNKWFLWPAQVLNPNSISISSAIVAGLTTVTDGQTDRQTTLLGLAASAT